MKKYIIKLINGKTQSVIQKWRLKKDQTYIIGRSDKVEICIQDDSISRKHAEITVLEDSITIKDLGSANGTFVDDKVAKSNIIIFLKNGTKVYLGDSPNYLQLKEKEKKSKKVSEESLVQDEEEEQEEIVKKEKKKKKKASEEDEEEVEEKVKSKKSKKEKEQKEERERSRSFEKEKIKEGKKDNKEITQPQQQPNLSVGKQLNAVEKRKLLWGNKKSDNLENKAQLYGKVEANSEETNKFFKLMGFKQTVEGKSTSTGVQNFFIKKSGLEKQTMINDLENQFNEGMKRKSGGKGGLGFN